MTPMTWVTRILDERREMASTIGEVIVTEASCENPYTYHGILRIGTMRKHALAAFRDGEDTTGMALWHAPASGGAHRIDRTEVDWSGMRT